MQMCKPCTHIIIVQIMINNAELHSIIIYKYEMDSKLYALTFKVGKSITRSFDNKYKYIAQAIYKKLPLHKQNVITNMMNQKKQIL